MKETECGTTWNAGAPASDLSAYLGLWASLFQAELLAQSQNPAELARMAETWTAWRAASIRGARPADDTGGRRSAAAWPAAAVPASDGLDAAIRRLERRIDELDAFLAASGHGDERRRR